MQAAQRPLVWCIDSPGFGGSERDFVRLIERGVPQPDLVVCGPDIAPELKEFLAVRGIPTRMGSQQNAVTSVGGGLVRAFSLLLSLQDAAFVVWAHHVDSSRWIQLALSLARRRFLVAERALPSTGEPFGRSRLTIPIKRIVIRRAHAVVLNARYQEGHYLGLFGTRGRLEIIPNSRDASRIAGEVVRARASGEASSSSGSGSIVCVARLAQEKGIRTLIDAYALLPRTERDRVRLVLVGDGPDRRSLESHARTVAPGGVVFAGEQKDPVPWLAGASVFVQPSFSEGLSGALIEAMAAGVPCVATDIPGNRELVAHGATGLLVAPGDARALGDAIRTVLRDGVLAARLARACQQLVFARHDEHAELEAWRRVLEELRSRGEARR